MPYPNEHAARVINPDFFEPDSLRSKELKDGIRLIVGKLKGGNGSMITQAYRFSVDNFTIEQAKKWLEDHKIKFIKFEPAENVSKKDILEHVGILGMKWGHRRSQGKSNSHPQKIDKFKKVLNKVKNRPASEYTKKDLQRGRRIASAILLGYIASPYLASGAKVAISIGKRKISDYNFNKYGGFNPKNVVNVKFRDAPVVPDIIKLLTKGP